jgi:zinc transport system substrate-binding protein
MVSGILRRVRTIAFALLPFSLALAVAVLPGCKSCGGGAKSERTTVAVSIFPIYDLTKRIAGPDADVALLLPAGRNEHSFDPTPKDIETASKAKLGVMVGLNLDPWMEKLLKDAAPTAKVLKVGDQVPTLKIKDDPIGADEHDDHDDHDHDHHDHGKGGKVDPHEDDHDIHDHDHAKGAPDPHVWLDPQRAQKIVRAIAEELARVDAAHATAYRERGTALEKELGDLDKEVETRTKALKRRGFVTFHGSFSYFAERYKLDILAVIEPFPGSQPTSDYVQKVLEVVKKKNVPALYSEPQLDPRPAKIIADEAKIPLGVLDPVGGQPETDSYVKMIRFDVAALEKHLK